MVYGRLALERLLLRQQERQRVASAGKAFYAPFKKLPDTRLPYYAALCNEACLELNPKTRPLYVEIMTALKRPGIKLLKSNHDMEHPDYVNLLQCTFKYILNAFNHPDYLDQPKINPDSDESVYLISVIIETAIIEMQGVTFKEIDQKYQGEDHRVMQLGTDEITNRADRARRARLVEIAKKYDLKLVHEDSLYLAKLWYKARVIFSSITEVASQEGVQISTLSHQIEIYDLATGYKREK